MKKRSNISRALQASATLFMAFPETRRKLADHSIRFFAWYYLGFDLSECQERWIYEMIRTRRGLVLAPAGHGKTEAIAHVLVLWLVARNRNLRILITMKSEDLAIKSIKVIKQELETNQRLIADYGSFYDPANVWQARAITVRRDANLKDATVEAVGMLGAITGSRFDVIIFDDIIDVLSVQSESVRTKTEDYVDGTLIPRLEPNGVVWAIGTRKHYDDIYNHFLKNPIWICVEEKAIIREPAKWGIVKRKEPIVLDDGTEQWYEAVIYSDDQGECLWDDRWSIKILLLHRFTIGTVVFDREYQNKIVSDETALFKLAWLEQCRDETRSYVSGQLSVNQKSQYVAIIQGVDPSLIVSKKEAEAKDSDYMVVATIGLRSDGKRDLLHLFRDRGLSPAMVENMIKVVYYQFDPQYCLLESNSFGAIHAHNLIENTGMKLVRHHTGVLKQDLYKGVPSLSVLFENAKFSLPYATPKDQQLTDIFINEFYRLGSEAHDDIVMAMWIAESGISRFLTSQAARRRNIERVRSIRRPQKYD